MSRTGVLGQATRIDPAPADHEALDELRERGDLRDGELLLRTADGTEISLPPSLLRLVVSAANNLAAGRAIMAIPAEVTLSPAEAAELLGLSRPFVARLLERGDIPSRFLPESRHRRVRLEDVLAFQARREHRAEGRHRIADIAATAGLPYLCLVRGKGIHPDPDDNVHMAAVAAGQVETLVTVPGTTGTSTASSSRTVRSRL
jgi:excisionase family DNA binding protein